MRVPVIVTAALLLLTAPAGGTAPVATDAAACAGTVKRKINSNVVRARSIRATDLSCRRGKRVIRRFFAKADRKPRCNRASKRPPPTSGCGIGRFNCFRGVSTYCAAPSARSVTWKE